MDKESITERDGLFTWNTNKNWRAVTKVRDGQWVGGTFDVKAGQFSDGRNFARGMSASALRSTYTRTFRTKREAMAWLSEK